MKFDFFSTPFLRASVEAVNICTIGHCIISLITAAATTPPPPTTTTTTTTNISTTFILM